MGAMVPPSRKSCYNFRVVSIDRVVDGDTIDVSIDLGFDLIKKERVRIAGVDTPEKRTRDLEEKALGIDATRSFPLRNDNDIVAMAIDQLGVEFYNLVYDLSDENSGGEPSFLSKFDLGGNAEQVSITDDGAYIACDDFGAYFISLESIRTGEGVAVSFAEDLTVDHVSVKSNVAVLSLGSRGLALYDVSNPLSPKSRGIFDVGYVYKTYFWGDHILICTRSGLQVSKIK